MSELEIFDWYLKNINYSIFYSSLNSERRLYIFECRNGIGRDIKTIKSLSNSLKISPTRVCQINNKIKRRIRKYSKQLHSFNKLEGNMND